MDYEKLIQEVEERIAQLEQFTVETEEWNELLNLRPILYRLIRITRK